MKRPTEPFPPVDFEHFHAHRLPQLLAAGNGRLAAATVRATPPIAFRSQAGSAYTYALSGQEVVVQPGSDEAATVVRVSDAQWSDFVNQIRSIPCLVYSGELDVERGENAHVLAWELALLALMHGRPAFDPAAALPRDDAGAPLDLRRAFTLDDSDAAVGAFLARAGFVLVRGVFDSSEVAELRRAADEVTRAARPGDRRSWWAHDDAGGQVLCRVTYANQGSARIAALSDDPRIRRLGRLLGPGAVDTPDRMDGHTVIVKNRAARDGLADLPWHVDCGMGGHALMCPILQLSLFLERADRDTGTLSVVPGSHRFATPMPTHSEEAAFNAIDIEAQAGDCSVHIGDTMHAAKTPAGPGPYRRSIVISFFQRQLLDIVGPGEAFNDVLLGRDDGHVEHI